MGKGLIIGIIVVVIVVLGLNFFGFNGVETEIEITDFDSCAAAGNPIAESYPRQCRTDDGRNFVEVIETSQEIEEYFTDEMWRRGVENLGGAMPIEGFDPSLYFGAFPGLVEEDFDNVSGINGIWVLEDGELSFVRENPGGPFTSADGTIDREGMADLLGNLESRFDVDVRTTEDVDELIDMIEGGEVIGGFSPEEDSDGVPTELSMPFNIEDVDPLNGEVNPLGVIRFSKDSGIGHPGIDIPLKQGSPIYAVADGPVVLVSSAGDPWNGMEVSQLLKQTSPGEGWAFSYEHIEIADGVSKGTELKRGDLIGTKIAPLGFTLHLELSGVFNNFEYTRDSQCWPDFLSSEEKEVMDSWWEGYMASSTLINAWGTTYEEGKYPFKGLLDELVYPEGPQLCYPIGTDVR